MENILVSDVMTRNLITITPNTTLFECAKKMVRKKVNSLVITDKKKFLGFITQKDILWAFIKKSKDALSKINAIDLSPKKVTTIKPTATIKEAIQKMNKMKFDRLPVINNGELAGIITVRDILGFHPEIYPELEEFAKVREEQEKLRRIKKAKERVSVSDGICEECGERDSLYRENGMLICASCMTII